MTELATRPARPQPARKPPPSRRPRRVSGPAPRPARGRALERRPFSERLAAFLRALPDHPLLDRIVRGRAWIPLLGLMLGGIVAMQVELLKLNATTGRSIELVGALESRNQVLRTELAAASNPGRIERLAAHMGMVMPGPEAITFLSASRASARHAAANIHLPDLAVFEAALQASNAATAALSPLLAPKPAPVTTSAPSAPATTTTTTTTAATTAATPTSTAPATATAPSAPPATVP